jgi:hypothetical protein
METVQVVLGLSNFFRVIIGLLPVIIIESFIVEGMVPRISMLGSSVASSRASLSAMAF